MTDKSTDEPIFLVGSERSGTTLLRLMLDHHPKIAFHFESEFLVTPLAGGADWPDLEDYYAMLELDRSFQERPFEIDQSLDYPQLARSFLDQRRKQAGKPIVGATVHTDFDQLPRIWPNARYIHIVRDGRDVARSAVKMGWAGHVWEGADRWIEAEQAWERFRGQLRDDQYTCLRFADLVRDPRGELMRICRFIGVPFDEAMLAYPQSSSYDAPDPSMAFQWKRKMDADQVRIVEARIGDMLVKRGYELSGHPPIEVDQRQVRAFRRQSRWGRARFRIRRYGPALYLAEMITRRLGLRGLNRCLVRRMNAIDDAHVK